MENVCAYIAVDESRLTAIRISFEGLPLKAENCHNANIVGTGGCMYGNQLCNQWRKISMTMLNFKWRMFTRSPFINGD